MTIEQAALQAAAQALVDKLREIVGPASVNNLSRPEQIEIATATVDAYLRAKIVSNGEMGGEP